MAERLTIKSGELNFYEKVYTKCSNKNSPEVRKKVKNGIPYYDIKEYKSKQYNTKELSDIYKKLSKLEDILEKYGIESVEELDFRLAFKQNDIFNYKVVTKLEQDRDTWKRACELACEEAPIHCPDPPEYYNAQNEYGSDEPYYIQISACEFGDDVGRCRECQMDFFYQQAKEEIARHYSTNEKTIKKTDN